MLSSILKTVHDDNINISSGTGSSYPGKASKTEFIVVLAFLLYFASKAFYFAFSIGENIFPDEISWFGLSEVFSRTLLLPADSKDTYQFGLVSGVPFLYFYLMGKVLSLNIFPVSDLIFLRSVNVCISILTVWFSWKLIRLLVSQTAARILFIALVTNTIMFTFVSSSVSYDNLINCFAVLALYYLFCFFQSRLSYNFLLFILFICMGMLTKVSFLPYAFTLLAVFLFHERKNFRSISSAALSLFSPFKKKNYILPLLCLFLITANVNLYLGNLIRYGSLQPNPIKIIGLENAMRYRLFARDYIVNLFMDGKISYPEAQKMAFKYIRHAGDRADALSMLERVAREKAWKQKPRIDRFRYAFSWIDLMMARTFNIAGHKVMYKSRNEMMPYFLILFMAGTLLVRRIKVSDLQGTGIYLLFIAGLYALILMQVVNYRIYFIYGSIGIALQGRYIFPVLVPIYVLTAYYLAGFGSKWWKWTTFLTVTTIFVYGEFPWFLRNVSHDWFLK
jgi:hypothetical protein